LAPARIRTAAADNKSETCRESGRGSVRGQDRLERGAFNILNRTRLGNAVTNPNLPDFGYIVSRVGSRSMQIGMQYIF